MKKFKNLINGKLTDSLSGKYFKNINPADNNDLICLFPDSNASDVDIAVKASQKAFLKWSNTPPPARGELIYKAAEMLLKKQKSLAEVIVHEMGKTIPEAMGDIKSSADVAYFMAGEGRRMYGQTTYSSLEKRWALTKRAPVGVCGLITAWNAPMAIVTWKLFPALICGNTVVLKPSEDAPLTAYLLGELLEEAGFPDGVVNIVFGERSEVGEALVRHPGVDLVSFTGSTQVGRLIAEECGRQLKKCSLELGGKNGLIVMDDADLNAAAKAVATGAFSTAGQRCASTSRVFVHKDVYAVFIKKLIRETRNMKVGIGSDPETKVCPIINRRQFERIMEYIEQGKKQGGKILYGGRVLTRGEYAKGNFIMPTIFESIDINSKIAQEEIFGPVLCVFKIKNLREGIKKINATNYGLTASIFTTNVNNAMFAIDSIQVGCCYVNAPTFGSEPHMPFGGLKNSGNGTREPGIQALDVFSDWKTIYIDYSSVSRNSQFKSK